MKKPKYKEGDVVSYGDKDRDRHLALGEIGAIGKAEEIGFSNNHNGREYRIDCGSVWIWQKERNVYLVCKAEDRKDK